MWRHLVWQQSTWTTPDYKSIFYIYLSPHWFSIRTVGILTDMIYAYACNTCIYVSWWIQKCVQLSPTKYTF